MVGLKELAIVGGILLIVYFLLAAADARGAECESTPVLRAAANFAVDLEGEPDTRPHTWGKAAAHEWIMEFRNVPPGKRVRITRVYGDFVAWPVGEVPPGTAAGVLFGLQTTEPDGSERVWPAADNTLVYIQHATKGEVARAPFDFRISGGALPDARMRVKVAVWLNDTGRRVHIEPTFVVEYVYE
jgi:hypothetical protein